MIRIVIADDHNLIRQCIVMLLDQVEDIEVVGEAANGHETLKLTQQMRPDVVLVDVAMPLLNGIETARQIREMDVETCVIILSMYSDEDVVRHAFRSGAKGYLLKSSVVEELLIAIRSASKGDIYLSPSIAQTVLSEYLQDEPNTEAMIIQERLSAREREILQLVVEGHTNRDVAQILSISAKTVERHRASLMKKLKVQNLPDLIRIALKHRLVYPDE